MTAPMNGPAFQRVAVIGLGIMGAPMARNLLAAGFEVAGYNRSRSPIERLAEAGGRAAASLADAVHDAEAVVTMLPDSPDVEAAALGTDGIFEHAASGTLFADMSTVRPDLARRLADTGAAKGIRVLDAPVSGGEQGAVSATLSIMAGGTADDFEYARPMLKTLGKTVVHVGPAGSGQTVKAANQLIVAGTIELVAEAITFLRAHGVDAEAAVSVLRGGLAGSAILDRKSANMLVGQFQPGFRIELHHKDLGIVTSAARDAGVATPLAATVAQLIGAMRAQGHGGLDHCSAAAGRAAVWRQKAMIDLRPRYAALPG